jgi:hypothetical protein
MRGRALSSHRLSHEFGQPLNRVEQLPFADAPDGSEAKVQML